VRESDGAVARLLFSIDTYGEAIRVVLSASLGNQSIISQGALHTGELKTLPRSLRSSGDRSEGGIVGHDAFSGVSGSNMCSPVIQTGGLSKILM